MEITFVLCSSSAVGLWLPSWNGCGTQGELAIVNLFLPKDRDKEGHLGGHSHKTGEPQ